MSYGWADYEKPEKEKGHLASKAWVNYRPTDDLAAALGRELKSAGTVQETLSELRREDQIIFGERF